MFGGDISIYLNRHVFVMLIHGSLIYDSFWDTIVVSMIHATIGFIIYENIVSFAVQEILIQL